MQTLEQFKQANNISNLEFYPSNHSSRFVASCLLSNGKKQKLLTTEVFDPKQPVYCYPTEVLDEESGEVVTIIYLSNKEPKEAAFTL